MPKENKYEKCIKEVKEKIKNKKIPLTYKCGKKICKSNAYAICNQERKK